MPTVREKLSNMFSKIMAGTITREEGTLLINDLAKENFAESIKDLAYLIDNPPSGVFPKTILHTIALSRNKAFNNLMIASLEHKNEGVTILAASELGRLRTEEAKHVLVDHLTSEVYHVRQASAEALTEFPDGFEILKKHILTHKEPFYRGTSAQALLKAGKKGMEALLSILSSGNSGAIATVAAVIAKSAPSIEAADIPKIFDALMLAGDKKDTASIIELLKLVAVLKDKARGFDGYVRAFADHPYELIRKEAKNTLAQITPGGRG